MTDQAVNAVPKNKLILSLFPGIDLFSKPFEALGFSVVRGPDMLLGQDIQDFHVPSGVFAGIIGGSPCQEFSALNRNEPSGYGLEMLNQYKRIVIEAQPKWWLLENVARVLDLKIDGYNWQRFPLNLAWYSDCSRLRHFQFGSNNGVVLNPPLEVTKETRHGAALASDERSFAQLKALQGLPQEFDLPSLTVEGKKRAVGNGVPLPLGQVLAELVSRDFYGEEKSVTNRLSKSVTLRPQETVTRRADKAVTCECGCGCIVVGRARYASPTCRKRASRRRKATYDHGLF